MGSINNSYFVKNAIQFFLSTGVFFYGWSGIWKQKIIFIWPYCIIYNFGNYLAGEKLGDEAVNHETGLNHIVNRL